MLLPFCQRPSIYVTEEEERQTRNRWNDEPIALSFDPVVRRSKGDPQHLTSQNDINGVQSHPSWQRIVHQMLWEGFLQTVCGSTLKSFFVPHLRHSWMSNLPPWQPENFSSGRQLNQRVRRNVWERGLLITNHVVWRAAHELGRGLM